MEVRPWGSSRTPLHGCHSLRCGTSKVTSKTISYILVCKQEGMLYHKSIASRIRLTPPEKPWPRPRHDTAVLKLLPLGHLSQREAQEVSGSPKSSTTTACRTSSRASTVRGQTTCRYQDHRKACGQNEVCNGRNACLCAKPGVGTKAITRRIDHDEV